MGDLAHLATQTLLHEDDCAMPDLDGYLILSLLETELLAKSPHLQDDASVVTGLVLVVLLIAVMGV